VRPKRLLLTPVLALIALGGCPKTAPVQTAPEQARPLGELVPEGQSQPQPEQASPVLEAPPQPAHAYEPPQHAAPRIHVVKKGETLYGIARRYYNDGRQWRRIFQANRDRIQEPNQLPVGLRLIIP